MGIRTLFDESTGEAGIEDAKRLSHLIRCRTKDQSAPGETFLLACQADCPLRQNTMAPYKGPFVFKRGY